MIKPHEYKERLLGVEGVSVVYGSKTVLNDISIDVLNLVRPDMEQGQVVALLGPSGCGKTQLFRCMAGLMKPTRGKVVLRDSSNHVEAGHVGLVQQAYPLLQHRTVMSNLLISPQATREKAIELLTRFHLLETKDRYPVELSGGQRQRVAIIQQLLMGNHFLLMDEPFSGLDILAKQNVCDIIHEVTNLHEDNTVIFTTHDIEVAVSVASHIWVMGQTKDAEGKPLGAKIVQTYDLIQRCISWHDPEERYPREMALVKEIKDLFPSLI